MLEIKKFKIPKLPRKLKKKLYGKRNSRKLLCLALLENKNFISKFVTNIIRIDPILLEDLLIRESNIPVKKEYIWNIQYFTKEKFEERYGNKDN